MHEGKQEDYNNSPPKKWARQTIQKADSANHWCGEIHWSHPLLLLGITDGQHVRSCQQTINSTNLSFIFREASHRIPYIGTFDRV